MKTAKFVKVMEGFYGVAKLYHLSEPMDDGRGNMTSDVIVISITTYSFGSVCETYIFAADLESNTAVHWGELHGSSRGHMDHARALLDAGYAVA